MKKKNRCINFIKGMAVFFVVCYHSQLYEPIAKYIYILADYALPFFFMVSGYFCRYKEGNYSILLKRKIKHCIKIAVGFALLYILWDCFTAIVNGRIIEDAILHVFNWTNFFSLVTCGWVNGLYWFVTVLIACYILQFIFCRYNLNRYAGIIALLFAIGEIGVGIWDHRLALEFPIYIYRSVWFTGLPFFMMGIYLQNEKNVFYKILKNNHQVLLAMFLMFLLLIKQFFCGNSYMKIRNPIVILIYTTIIFVYAVKNEDKYFIRIIEEIGEKYYLFIYVSHGIVAYYFNSVLIRVNLLNNTVLLLLYPFIIYGLCFGLAKSFYFCKNKITGEYPYRGGINGRDK